MSTDHEETQLQVAANLPRDLALLKMENESIQAMAAAHPRNHESIKKEMIAQLEAYPSFAKSAIYEKPIGIDPDTGLMKYARGLSIRAAEALAEAYGFNRVRCDLEPLEDDCVRITASFTDYQKGRTWQDSGIVSKWYRGGKRQAYKMIKHADDRFYSVVCKAEASRRIREVIIRSIPPGLRAELMEMAEKRIDSLLDDTTMDKICAKFSTKGVPLEALEKRIGRTRKTGWTVEDRSSLLMLWNAIEDQETTVREAFGDIMPEESKSEEKPPTQPGNGPVTGESLGG